jgi:hypothetical protein
MAPPVTLRLCTHHALKLHPAPVGNWLMRGMLCVCTMQDLVGDELLIWRFLTTFSETLALDTVSLEALDAALVSNLDPGCPVSAKQAALLNGVHIALVCGCWRHLSRLLGVRACSHVVGV